MLIMKQQEAVVVTFICSMLKEKQKGLHQGEALGKVEFLLLQSRKEQPVTAENYQNPSPANAEPLVDREWLRVEVFIEFEDS